MVEGVVFEGTLRKKADAEFKRDDEFINGFENYELAFQENVEVSESRIMRVVNPEDDHNSLVDFHSLVPGSVVIVKLVAMIMIMMLIVMMMLMTMTV